MVIKKTSSNNFKRHHFQSIWQRWIFIYYVKHPVQNSFTTHQPSEEPQNTTCTYCTRGGECWWCHHDHAHSTCKDLQHISILLHLTHSHVVVMRCFSPRDFHLFLDSHQTRVKPQLIWGLICGDDLTGIFHFDFKGDRFDREEVEGGLLLLLLLTKVRGLFLLLLLLNQCPEASGDSWK